MIFSLDQTCSLFQGLAGNAGNQFNISYGIALHPTSRTLYIADYNNQRIMSYPSGVMNGSLLFGGRGSGGNNTQLAYPVGLYYETFSNTLIIDNYVCHNIVRYVFGSSSWTLVAGNINCTSGRDSTSLLYPSRTTLDPMGNLYVADRNNQRIQFFPNGEIHGITIAGKTGVGGNDTTTFNAPWAVALDSQLNFYVADSLNHRIQKFLRY